MRKLIEIWLALWAKAWCWLTHAGHAYDWEHPDIEYWSINSVTEIKCKSYVWICKRCSAEFDEDNGNHNWF